MEFPAHIVFSCLLVCQSAIFIDSKRGGKQSFPKAEGTSRWLLLQHGEDDVSSFTLNPSWLSCEDETQRCIMVEIYLEP